MNEKYIQLFTELSHTLELLAEQAMEKRKNNAEKEKMEAATKMRENYMNIYDKIRNNKIMQLTLSDFAHLYIASDILINQLESKKKNIESVIYGYKIDILPKLKRILNETNNDLEAIKLAEELFSIEKK